MRYAISDMRMIIGIDARFFGPRAKGLGRYTQKLIENLEKIDGKNVYIVFLREKDFESYFPQNKNFKKVLADFPCYGFFEQIFFPFLIGRHGIDLMHFPHFNAPIFYRKKFVVTIHDLILRHFPPKKAGVLEGLKYFIKDLAYRAVIRRAIKKSGRVVAVSEFVKKDILAHYKITPKKIRVIYEGSPDFQDSDKQKESNVAARNSFILYVGNAYPHKNLDVLIDGFLLYLDNSGDKITKLVLAGENDYFYERLKRQKSGPISKYPDRIVFRDLLKKIICRLCIKKPRLMFFLPSAKASVCLLWKRWLAARRLFLPMKPLCLKFWEMPPFILIRAIRKIWLKKLK